MDVALPKPSPTFTSNAQRARVATEMWAAKHLFCPRCDSDHLSPLPTNNPVVDFACPGCTLAFQLKAKAGPFGPKFANSAYAPKIEAIRKRAFPDYALLSYHREAWRVLNVTLVPGFFLTGHTIERREPLAATARRAGWVGSNVLLANLPGDAKIPVLVEGVAVPRDLVREKYGEFEDLRSKRLEAATWTVDVLTQLRKFAPVIGMTFTLTEFYDTAEAALARLHPENKHVRDKIRQQLQVLRDRGVLRFEGRGSYQIVG